MMKKNNNEDNLTKPFAKTIEILKLVSDLQYFEAFIKARSNSQHLSNSAYTLSDDELLNVAGGLNDDIRLALNPTDKDKR